MPVFLSIAQFLFSILPMIGPAVQAAEAAFPGAGTGPQKLAHVLSPIQAAVAAVPDVLTAGAQVAAGAESGSVEQMTQGAAALVNYTVKLMNQAGAFQKSGVVQAITAANPQDAADPSMAQPTGA